MVAVCIEINKLSAELVLDLVHNRFLVQPACGVELHHHPLSDVSGSWHGGGLDS